MTSGWSFKLAYFAPLNLISSASKMVFKVPISKSPFTVLFVAEVCWFRCAFTFLDPSRHLAPFRVPQAVDVVLCRLYGSALFGGLHPSFISVDSTATPLVQ